MIGAAPAPARPATRAPAPLREATDDGVSVPNPDAILELGALAARRRLARRETGAPARPSKQQVSRVMRQLRPEVQACFDRHQNAGTLTLRITVQPYGRGVGEALGALAGTPTAACVLGKLPHVSFPRFSGEAFSFNYAYTLQ